MLIRNLSQSETAAANQISARPAWEVFIESQKTVKPPYAMVLQAEHSRLAGQLASALRTDVFGELNPEVIQAAAEHDFGWNASDQQQIDLLGESSLRPFPSLSAEETLPSWRDSIAHARSVTPLVEALVSRHFSLLGAGDPDRADFVRYETERRKKIESTLPFVTADLDRWTAAIGFCDLLSLYLCSGCQNPVEFPLAHPAAPAANEADRVSLFFRNGSPRFSSAVLKPETKVCTSALIGTGTNLSSLTLEWSFVQGSSVAH